MGARGQRELKVIIAGDAKGAVRALNQVDGAAGRTDGTLARMGAVARRAFAVLTTAAVVALGASAHAAIDFESAFAGVRKTVDASETELAELRDGIRQMARELPATREEIAGVAEAAGQLGIQTGAILDFTKVMIDLGESTNLTSDEAATSLAQLANITQMAQTEFSRLGATVVALGNAGASTEADIVAMGLRIAGAGNQIGLTEAQILGFASALSSVGIEAEAGGSAISRVMADLAKAVAGGQKSVSAFAKVAGVSSKAFIQAFKTDAAGALITFIEGLDRMSKSGGNVFKTLDDLDMGSIRVRDTLLRAAGAGDLMRQSLDLGAKAWGENTALTKEAEQRYATTASQLQILKNNVTDVALSIGEALLPGINSATTSLRENMPAIETFVTEGLAKIAQVIEEQVMPMLGVLAAWWHANAPLIGAVARVAFGVVAEAIGLVVRNMELLIPVATAALAGLLAFKAASLVAAGLQAIQGAFLTARGAIESFKLQLHLAHMQGLSTGQALTTMLRPSIAGVSTVLGIAVGAWAAWRAAKENAKRITEQLTQAIIADSGALAQNTRALTFNKLERDGVLGVARKLGVAIDDVIDASLGDEAAQKRVAAALKIHNNELERSVKETGRYAPAHQAMAGNLRKLQGAIDANSDATRAAEKAAAEYIVTVGDMKPSVDRARTALESLSQVDRNLAARMMAAGGSVGRAFGQGVAQGISALTPELQARANTLIDSTIIAAKRRAGIASPSKRARDELGKPLAQGMALGIQDGQLVVNDALSDVIRELLAKSPAVRTVVAEAERLGLTISDDVAKGIASGHIAVNDAMGLLMQGARERALEEARKIAEEMAAELQAGFDSIMGGFGAFSGITSARRSLRAAEKELRDALNAQSSLPGQIAAQDRLVDELRAKAKAVTPAEERAIIEARQKLRQAEEALNKVQKEQAGDADAVRLAELDLFDAKEKLTEAVKASTGPTDELSKAVKKLGDLRREQEEIDLRVRDAQEGLIDAQLRLVEAQQRMEEAQKRLIEQGPAGEQMFRDIAARAGLAQEAIDSLVRSFWSLQAEFGKVPDALPVTHIPGMGVGSGPTRSVADAIRRIGTLEKRLSNPNTSPEHRQRYSAELGELRTIAGQGSGPTVQFTGPIAIHQPMDVDLVMRQAEFAVNSGSL